MFKNGHLNSLGYQLISLERVADAIEIFKLNIEVYPKNANGYDSLGEATSMDFAAFLSFLSSVAKGSPFFMARSKYEAS